MQDWQKRQKHEEDLKRILRKAGCLDGQGRMVRWRGPEVVPLIEAAGHDFGAPFDQCRCRNAKP